MSFELKEVKCNDSKCLNSVKLFCRKWSSNHPKMGLNIPINLYVDSYGEFIGFDSPKFKISFMNQNRKLSDIPTAEVVKGDITLEMFYDHIVWDSYRNYMSK